MPKIALIQLSADARPSVNKEKTESAIREAAANGAQIVCTQELFTTEYFCRTEECDLFNLAEPVPGELTEANRKLAAELGVVIVASGFEKRATGLYHNTAWVVDADGSFLGMYRKMHIPQDPGFEEKFYFTPGDLGYKAFDTKFGRIGVLICWDQWYPEGARIMALKGAELLIYPTAIGWESTDTQEEKMRRLAAGGKAPAGGTAALRVGNRAARPCRGQRLLCLRRQPGGDGRGKRILGAVLCGGLLWPDCGESSRQR